MRCAAALVANALPSSLAEVMVMKPGGEQNESAAVAERYARRRVGDRYSLLRPEVWQSVHERQREMLRILARSGLHDPTVLRLLEVGCGSGGNLLELLRMGFVPEHLCGIELLPERWAQARHVLPAVLSLIEGDALKADVPAASQDIVFVSTVFSSLLDDAFQQRLADAMWRWVRPGGAVLWYDFTMNNPRNPDVRGVPLARVRALFGGRQPQARKVTLAPPIARAVCRLHPALYTLCNALPPLRTHLLCWIVKPLS